MHALDALHGGCPPLNPWQFSILPNQLPAPALAPTLGLAQAPVGASQWEAAFSVWDWVLHSVLEALQEQSFG